MRFVPLVGEADAIHLVVVALARLAAADGGGKAGERYHHKVDRVGFTD